MSTGNMSTTQTSLLVQVPFYGDILDAYREGEDVWVSVRRVSEALGLLVHGQLEKLKTAEWAVIQMICMTGPDGKNYEVSAVHLDSLPMWLANIHASKVREEIRPKLIKYQKECAKVLHDHFFGRQSTIDEAKIAKIAGDAAVAAVRAMLPELFEAKRLSDPRAALFDYEGAYEVCEKENIPQKGRGGFLRALSSVLTRFCVEKGWVPKYSAFNHGQRKVAQFPIEATQAWRLSVEGKAWVARVRHILAFRHTGQTVLPFPVGGRKGVKK